MTAVSLCNAGAQKLNQKKYKLASQYFTKALAKNPKLVPALINLAICKRALKDNKGSIEDLEKALKLDPKNSRLYQERGLTKAKLLDYESAKTDHTKAISLKPKYVEAYYQRGLAEFSLKEFQEASKDFEKAIQLRPKFIDAHLMIGICRSKLGDPYGAIAKYDYVLSIQPNQSTAFMNRASVKYNFLNDSKGAIDDVTIALNISLANRLSNTLTLLVNRGLIRFRSLDYLGAMEDFNQGIILFPKNSVSYTYRAFLKHHLGDFNGSMEDYNMAVTICPNSGQLHCMRGLLNLELYDYTAAQSDFSKSLSIDREFEFFLLNQGFLYLLLGRYDEAEKELNKVLAIKSKLSKDFISYQRYSMLLIGVITWCTGKCDQIMTDRMHVIYDQLDPFYKIQFCTLYLGFFFMELSKKPQLPVSVEKLLFAIKSLRLIIELNLDQHPKEPRLLFYSGYFQGISGEAEESRKSLKQCLLLSPRFSQARRFVERGIDTVLNRLPTELDRKPDVPPIASALPIGAMSPERVDREESEKSWHFDPSTIIELRDQSSPLIPASEKDKAKVVGFYLQHPVLGYDIKSIELIYNRTLNRRFSLHLELLQGRCRNPAFEPKWMEEPGDTPSKKQKRREVHQLIQSLAAKHTDPDYPDITLLPLWHGTNPSVIQSICRSGFANLATTDAGYFGKGIYSANEASYSFKYSNGTIILNWVGYFSAYPVIDGDMPKLIGKGNYQNYDAHVVPIKKSKPPKIDQAHEYIEVVVFDPSACLPRFLVTLQPKGLGLLNPALSSDKSEYDENEGYEMDDLSLNRGLEELSL